MTVLLGFLLPGGMPAGLAAYLQADMQGRGLIADLTLALLAGIALSIWALMGLRGSEAADHDPRGVLGGVMITALIGAAIGMTFSRKIEPFSPGLRTAVAVSIVGFVLNVSGVLQ